jgi:pimeloyl-ACP methyl ester carboxylesterase
MITRNDLTDVVLVGHSFGGAVVGPVADRIPDRIGRLVHVAGTPLPPGTSLFDLIGPEGQKMIEGMAVAAGDPDRLPG